MRTDHARSSVAPIRAAALPTLRVIPWGPPAIAFGGGLLAVALAYRGAPIGTGVAVQTLRLASLVLAAGVASALDDPAASMTDATSVPAAARRGLRVVITVASGAVAWALALGIARWRFGDAAIPVSWLTLEVAALAAAALAVATTVIGRGHSSGTSAAAPALLCFAIAFRLIPDRWTLLGGEPGTAMWTQAHQRWAILLAACALIVVRGMRDPAARRPVAAIRAALVNRRGHSLRQTGERKDDEGRGVH